MYLVSSISFLILLLRFFSKYRISIHPRNKNYEVTDALFACHWFLLFSSQLSERVIEYERVN